MLQKDSTILQNLSTALECEWLETNALGGYSSSTIIGCNTRRYHGLLVAATKPPTERMVLVSKLEETIVIGDDQFELSANEYGDVVHPNGYHYINEFTRNLFPQFTYKVAGVTLKKTITMVHQENSTIIIYDVLEANTPFTLQLLPLLAVRNHHELVISNNAVNTKADFKQNVFSVNLYNNTPTVFIKIPGAKFHEQPQWFYSFTYQKEKERGLEYEEDLFSHGLFSVDLKQGDSLGIILSVKDPTLSDAHDLLEKETNRKKSLLENLSDSNSILSMFQLAADQFIVKRNIGSTEAASVIAGYHWFTDWSRDTMISLPGLALYTGRYKDAQNILRAFAHSSSMGMLPNRFTDEGGLPEYNNVDGTLWFFIAVYKYWLITKDNDFILTEILPVLKDIVEWHYKGTRYNIHVAEDGLLYAGEQGQQLTWMDARVDNWVVTPRMGKPVEVQALWYNTLKIYATFLLLNQEKSDAAITESHAAKAKESFQKLFWYAEGNYLYDNIDENNIPDKSLRPNQLFAISLPFTLIEGEQAIAILNTVKENLYTPVGLRSLAANDKNYKSIYTGNLLQRDVAYHQGTVWSWLLGPYVDALIKVKGEAGYQEAKTVIDNIAFHLNEAGVGSISEIFDAEAPHHPRGCIAQAWGVAELLRVMKEYNLGTRMDANNTNARE
ncbi:MAG: amylo-alpha-1,6-glucosidase [Chitinophagaceae bacterium]